jgi:hypothetical protein
MKTWFRFLASSTGRLVRALVGLALVAIGAWLAPGAPGWIVALVGLVPLAAGLFDWCVLAPLFGLPFSGWRLRVELGEGAHA